MGKKLSFRKEYGRDIMLGRKTTTARLHTNLKKGDIVNVKVGNIHVGKALIENVTTKKVRDLTDTDAMNDGFKDREEMINGLKKIYGKRVTEGTEIKLIRFKLLDMED